MNEVPKRSVGELFREIAEDRLSPRSRREESRETSFNELSQEIFPRTDSSPRQSSTIVSFELLRAFTPLGVTR